MEQTNVMLTVPKVSSTGGSTTHNTSATSSSDDNFSDLYQKNIGDTGKTTDTKNSQQENTVKDEQASKNSEMDDKTQTKKESSAVKNDDVKESSVSDTPEKSEAVWQALQMMIDASEPAMDQSQLVESTDMDSSSSPLDQIIQQFSETFSTADGHSDDEKVVETSEGPPVSTQINNETSKVKEQTESNQTTEVNVTQAATTNAANVESAMAAIASQPNAEANENRDAVGQIESFVNTLPSDNVVSTTQFVDTAPITDETTTTSSLQQSILDQIQSAMGKVTKSGVNEIRLQLEPENLGVLNIRIVAGKDGTQIVFKTDNLQSSQLIAGQTESLKTMMADSGIKVDQVIVNDFSFSQQNFSNQQQQFEQKQNRNYAQNLLLNVDQSEQWNSPYEVAQSVVGLNYLV